jgi:hypothetical protein
LKVVTVNADVHFIGEADVQSDRNAAIRPAAKPDRRWEW